MLPASAASSAPNRCSSVLFPDPLRPSIARNSPFFTARSTPLRTCNVLSPMRNFLTMALARKIGVAVEVVGVCTACVMLLPAQRLYGIHPSRAHGWNEGAQHRRHDRDA